MAIDSGSLVATLIITDDQGTNTGIYTVSILGGVCCRLGQSRPFTLSASRGDDHPLAPTWRARLLSFGTRMSSQ